jgi:hypothetical protein
MASPNTASISVPSAPNAVRKHTAEPVQFDAPPAAFKSFGPSFCLPYRLKPPLEGENRLALWIYAIHIGLLASLLKRDENEPPRPHKLLGRLSDRARTIMLAKLLWPRQDVPL